MENSGLQPGQTVAPSSAPAAPKQSEPVPAQPDQAAPALPKPTTPPPAPPTPPPEPTPAKPAQRPPAPAQPPAQPEPTPDVPTGLQPQEETMFNPNDDGDQNTAEPGQAEVNWTASEFIAHEKSAGWYLALALVAAVIAGLVYLITRDFVSVGVVIFGALMFGVYGARQPRQLDYRMDSQGVQIGQKYYNFNEFRTFMIIPEGAFSSIVFMPLKRFAPPTTIYYDPKDEENILNILSDRLPFEEGGHDAVDRLMRRIRF